MNIKGSTRGSPTLFFNDPNMNFNQKKKKSVKKGIVKVNIQQQGWISGLVSNTLLGTFC